MATGAASSTGLPVGADICLGRFARVFLTGTCPEHQAGSAVNNAGSVATGAASSTGLPVGADTCFGRFARVFLTGTCPEQAGSAVNNAGSVATGAASSAGLPVGADICFSRFALTGTHPEHQAGSAANNAGRLRRILFGVGDPCTGHDVATPIVPVGGTKVAPSEARGLMRVESQQSCVFDAFSGVSTLPGCPVKARRGARKEARKVAKGCEVALYRVCKRTVPSLGLLIDESDAAVKPQSVVCGFGLVFP